MRDEIRKHLHGIHGAASAIRGFVTGKRFEDYRADELLRSAVERKFEIIGEALNRIHKEAPETLSRIHNHRDMISFRNILAHGYDSVDDRIVWGIIEEDIDRLIADVSILLEQE